MTGIEQSQAPQTGPELVKELVAFCQRRGRGIFSGWSAEDIARWLEHHLARHSILYLRDESGRVVALATARLNGDEFYFEKVMAARPGALAQLVREFKRRFPQWRQWRLFRHCHANHFRPVTADWLERIETLNA